VFYLEPLLSNAPSLISDEIRQPALTAAKILYGTQHNLRYMKWYPNYDSCDSLLITNDPGESRDPWGQSASHHFAARGDLESVLKTLFLKGSSAGIRSEDVFQRSPLHFAACSGNLDLVHRLIGWGAVIHHPDSQGWTPLQVAAWKDHRAIVNELLTCYRRRDPESIKMPSRKRATPPFPWLGQQVTHQSLFC
jgi:ankyrin repeat protein